jgi:hypothetical protein
LMISTDFVSKVDPARARISCSTPVQ